MRGSICILWHQARDCNASTPRRQQFRDNRKSAHLWNDEIATLLQLRRRITTVRQRGPNAAELESENVRNEKKDIKHIIYKSKMLKWVKLSQDVNNDHWGLRYKIVLHKFSTKTANLIFERDRMWNIVDSVRRTGGYLAKMNCQERPTFYKSGKRLDQMQYQ